MTNPIAMLFDATGFESGREHRQSRGDQREQPAPADGYDIAAKVGSSGLIWLLAVLWLDYASGLQSGSKLAFGTGLLVASLTFLLLLAQKAIGTRCVIR